LSLNTISILRNNGNGTFASQETINTSTFGGGLELADFDQDGDFDILYKSSSSFGSATTWRIYENENGNYTLYSNESNPASTTPIDVRDFNGDGDLEILTLNPGTGLVYKLDSLNIPLSGLDTINPDQTRMHAGDLDGDGDQDLFQYWQYNGSDWFSYPLKTWINDGSGSFDSISGNFNIATRPANKLCDIDGDGDLDFLYIKSDGKIHYAENINCTIVCRTSDDFIPGSLRAAIDCAQPGDTILFDSQLANDTIHLDVSELVFDKELFIIIPDTMNVWLEGNMSGLMISITPGGDILIDGLNLVVHNSPGQSPIRNAGQLTLKDLTIYGQNLDPAVEAIIENLNLLNFIGTVNIIQQE
jgi:hypothetical protein